MLYFDQYQKNDAWINWIMLYCVNNAAFELDNRMHFMQSFNSYKELKPVKRRGTNGQNNKITEI